MQEDVADTFPCYFGSMLVYFKDALPFRLMFLGRFLLTSTVIKLPKPRGESDAPFALGKDPYVIQTF